MFFIVVPVVSTVRSKSLTSELLIVIYCSTKPAKVKNIKRSSLGDKLGRIHMKPQNLDNMGGRRVDALRNKKRPASSGADGGEGSSSGGRSTKKARA